MLTVDHFHSESWGRSDQDQTDPHFSTFLVIFICILFLVLCWVLLLTLFGALLFYFYYIKNHGGRSPTTVTRIRQTLFFLHFLSIFPLSTFLSTLLSTFLALFYFRIFLDFWYIQTLLNQRGRSLTTVTRIRLTLILVWILLVAPGEWVSSCNKRFFKILFFCAFDLQNVLYTMSHKGVIM